VSYPAPGIPVKAGTYQSSVLKASGLGYRVKGIRYKVSSIGLRMSSAVLL
jgi:hypothetical protein